MTKDTDPWFKFFPDRWQNSLTIRRLTLEQQGIFMQCLCFSWRDGGIKVVDTESIAEILKIEHKLLISTLQVTYKIVNDKYINDVQEEIRFYKNDSRDKQAAGGRKAQLKRWEAYKLLTSGLQGTLSIKNENGETEQEGDKKQDKKKEKHYTVKFDRTTGMFTGISELILLKWKTRFPGIDIKSKLSDLELWIMGKPEGTIKNYTSFITNCLKKEKPVNEYGDDPEDEIVRDAEGKIISKYGMPYHG